jgi:Mn2+/Fe2+ NRAMP family transporter
MGVFLATVFGFSLWIVLYALGVKAFDGFLLVLAIIVLAATGHIVAKHMPRRDER